MNLVPPPNPFADLSKSLSEVRPQIEYTEYEDTIFKEMAEDIKSSQKTTDAKIEQLINENRKANKSATIIATITLVVGILTLIATIIGILI